MSRSGLCNPIWGAAKPRRLIVAKRAKKLACDINFREGPTALLARLS